MADPKQQEKPPTLEELKKKLAAAEKARDAEMEKDWQSYANNVAEKFFGGYQKSKQWLDKRVHEAETRVWVISPFGRRRTMYRIFTGSNKYIADAGRRAKNSPIQGISSEVGVTAGYLILQHIHAYLLRFELPIEWMSLYARAVHDASYFEEVVDMLIPALHINQWVATQGVTNYYEEVFNFKFILSPEIALDYGADAKNSYEWNWDLTTPTREDWGGKPVTLPEIFKQVLMDLAKKKLIKESKIDSLYARIWEPWINKEKRHYLQGKYPLLLVPNLEKQICFAVKQAGFKPEK